jgi:hypothetical protein
MISFVAILILGFVLGMRHATDPDHVIAVTTIVSKQRGFAKAGLIGVFWGLGHTLTIFLVGAAIILFKVAIPPRIGLAMELAVGLMLIVLGVLNLTGVLGSIQNKFAPANSERLGSYNILRPLAIGIVHGLAGSAAVALLVMTTIGDPWWAIGYLLIFGAGTIAGMMLITAAIGLSFTYTADRFAGWNRWTAVGSGLLSLSFGLFLSFQIGIVDGLFGANPQWTPR